MAKVGRKKRVWLDDFKEQQKVLLEKHAMHEPLTYKEISYLVAKDGSMPTCKEQMMSTMAICKIEAKALKKIRVAIKALYPKYTENELKELFFGSMLHERSYARIAHQPEQLDYTYTT